MEDLFNDVLTTMVQGQMIHEQLIEYFLFLGDEELTEEQTHYYKEETHRFIKLVKFYVRYYNKVVDIEDVTPISIVPENWKRYTRQDVDPNNRQKYIKDGLNRWLEWEKQAKAIYENKHTELLAHNEISSAWQLLHIVVDVDKEISNIERKLLEF